MEIQGDRREERETYACHYAACIKEDCRRAPLFMETAQTLSQPLFHQIRATSHLQKSVAWLCDV
eukprot:1059372-Pelagomonas_calceolata.AAC.11